MRAWWISWYNDVDLSWFELHSPWWISGEDMDGHETMVAAVRADDEDAAMAAVVAAYDYHPGDVRWRFCDPLERSPFSDRFPQARWMAWTEDATCACDKCSAVTT